MSSSLFDHSQNSWSSINFHLKTKQASSDVGGKAYSKALFSLIDSMSSISAIEAGRPLPNLRCSIVRTSGV